MTIKAQITADERFAMAAILNGALRLDDEGVLLKAPVSFTALIDTHKRGWWQWQHSKREAVARVTVEGMRALQ